MAEHVLKTWPVHYNAVEAGYKPFEVRLDDRSYAVGDVLRLRYFNPHSDGDAHNGEEIRRRVTYLLPGGQFGIERGYVVMGLAEESDRGAELERELARLRSLIDNPHIGNFLEGVRFEAVHQVERWGEDHDARKSPEDWLWTIAYLSTKAAQAARYGDANKYLHHIVTTAAACLNWHRLASAPAAKVQR